MQGRQNIQKLLNNERYNTCIMRMSENQEHQENKKETEEIFEAMTDGFPKL